MTSLPIALALSAALASDAAPPLSLEPPPPWELGVAAGGGWDSNPLASIEPADAAFVAARAWLARELRASEDDLFWLQLRYDGTRFDTLSDADLDRFEGSLEWGHRFPGGHAVRAIAFGALREAGGAGRSGWDAGGRLVGRLRLGARVGLRAGGGYVRREASDPAFSASTGRLEGGVDADLWRGASALVRYALDFGTDTVVVASGGGGGGWGGGGGMMGSAESVRQVTQGISADLRQDLPGGFFLQAGYGVSFVQVEGTSLVEHQAIGELGWSR